MSTTSLSGREIAEKFLEYFDSPRGKILEALKVLISEAKKQSGKYHHLGSSPYDNNLGYTEYDLKKYKKLLREKTGKFKKERGKEIKELGIREEIDAIIAKAKAFEGKDVFKKDPNATPGRNHHTGRPYY